VLWKAFEVGEDFHLELLAGGPGLAVDRFGGECRPHGLVRRTERARCDGCVGQPRAGGVQVSSTRPVQGTLVTQ
jgi:hypothetical protein